MKQENFWKNLKKDYFKIKPEIKKTEKEIAEELGTIIEKIIKKTPKNKKIGVLFSGGIDSTLIAFLLKKSGYNFTCYTVALEDSGMETSRDLISSRKVAKELGFNLIEIRIEINKIPKYIKKIIKLIKKPDVVKVGVALTIYPAMLKAQKDKVKLIFSGLGSEEIFAGYERHSNSKNINRECLNGLLGLYNRDLQRDLSLAKDTNLKIITPFLDLDLVKYSLKIPAKYKIVKNQKKAILRKAAIKLRLKKEITQRKKLAAQYGSKMDKAIRKLAKREKISKKDYINKFIFSTSKP